MGEAERRRAAELDIQLQRWITQGLSQRRELGEALEALGDIAKNRVGVVARAEQLAAVMRGGHDRQRLLDDAQRLFRRVGLQGGLCGINRKASRTLRVTCRQSVSRDEWQRGW